jgi:uncharacterized ion transporter superfamily protein YfcC
MSEQKFPHALVILFGFFAFSCILAFIVPQGQYERQPDSEGNERVVQDSYQTVATERITVKEILISIPEGIAGRADVIVLVFLLGGCFYVVEKTGALREGITFLAGKVTGKEEIALVVVAVIFATGGALAGLQEEIIAMTPVLILLCRKLGYNTFVAVSVSFGAAIIGGAFSPMNPFAVLIAQKISGVPLLSGSGFRLVVMLAALGLWVLMLIRYGNRNRIQKEKSESGSTSMSGRGMVIFGMLILAFSYLAYGMVKLEWGFYEMSALFFVVGVVAGLIGHLGVNGTAIAYVEGFREMTFAAILIGVANSIPLILQKGIIIDSIVYGIFTPLQFLPAGLSAITMMFSQLLLHYPIPSYSGQAILTMPILSPLSDLIGLSRQVCVLAYQYGAVMMDLIVPTNGALMAVLAIAGISYDKWFRFIWKPMLIILTLAAVALVVAVMTGV